MFIENNSIQFFVIECYGWLYQRPFVNQSELCQLWNTAWNVVI